MSATLDKVSIGQMSVLVRGQLAIIYWLNSTSDCNHWWDKGMRKSSSLTTNKTDRSVDSQFAAFKHRQSTHRVPLVYRSRYLSIAQPIIYHKIPSAGSLSAAHPKEYTVYKWKRLSVWFWLKSWMHAGTSECVVMELSGGPILHNSSHELYT